MGKVRHDAERLSAPRRGRRHRDLGQKLACSRAACLRLETKVSEWAPLDRICNLYRRLLGCLMIYLEIYDKRMTNKLRVKRKAIFCKGERVPPPLEAISQTSLIYILAHAGDPLPPMPPASGKSGLARLPNPTNEQGRPECLCPVD